MTVGAISIAAAQSLVAEAVEAKRALLEAPEIAEACAKAAEAIVLALQSGGRVRLCGNGGSAADAQHLAAELSGRYLIDREGVDADALHVNTSYLTAVANDYGYVHVYSRLVRATLHTGDVLICISTSGNAANVLAALESARTLGVVTVGMTGESGGRMRELCDVLVAVPSSQTPRIQEAHITLGHVICHLVEQALFGDAGARI